MSKPNNFILNTDYASLKNDAKGSVTIIVPANIVIPASGTYTYIDYKDVEIGRKSASSRVQISSSRLGNDMYATLMLYTTGKGRIIVDGSTYYTDYLITSFFTRINDTTVRASVYIPNQTPYTLYCENTVETIKFNINTFLSPFA